MRPVRKVDVADWLDGRMGRAQHAERGGEPHVAAVGHLRAATRPGFARPGVPPRRAPHQVGIDEWRVASVGMDVGHEPAAGMR
ncbi:hypothetical protein [Mycolicibacterium litorale]|uniref:hypothetical protein n=1 Tax=Mycolicibacterium litorale TaxID=758802 RepID=UPI00162978D6|nr:hypothetical protein [Mycolicibacterium litorale]